MAKTPEQMRTLERSLAYEMAVGTIEGQCLHVQPDSEDHHPEYWDLNDEGRLPDVDLLIAESVEYLEWRGLLVRRDGNPYHVSILDEQELPGEFIASMGRIAAYFVDSATGKSSLDSRILSLAARSVTAASLLHDDILSAERGSGITPNYRSLFLTMVEGIAEIYPKEQQAWDEIFEFAKLHNLQIPEGSKRLVDALAAGNAGNGRIQ